MAIYTPYDYYEQLEPAQGYHYDEDIADYAINWYTKNLCFTSADWMDKPFEFLDLAGNGTTAIIWFCR